MQLVLGTAFPSRKENPIQGRQSEKREEKTRLRVARKQKSQGTCVSHENTYYLGDLFSQRHMVPPSPGLGLWFASGKKCTIGAGARI